MEEDWVSSSDPEQAASDFGAVSQCLPMGVNTIFTTNSSVERALIAQKEGRGDRRTGPTP
jgi:hypothetical protein